MKENKLKDIRKVSFDDLNIRLVFDDNTEEIFIAADDAELRGFLDLWENQKLKTVRNEVQAVVL